MASWDQQTSPMVKFEDSPAESFISTPGEMYPSLFDEEDDDDATPSASHAMDPSDMMTPRSFSEERSDESMLSALADGLSPEDDQNGSDRKQTKKRKSWGQVLPEPKTNLPPRKRAKTDDEKEQRRVERVLRNRRAAQSSRERKRLEVEALEQRNKELENALHNAQKTNLILVEELNKFRRDSGVVTRGSSPLDSLRPKPVTFSQELFSSQDGHRPSMENPKSSLMDDLINSAQSTATVNPASLSPELSPIPESDEIDVDADAMAETSTVNTSHDLTQRPAAMLCDLQCHQSTELPQSWLASQSPLHPTLVFYLQLQMLLATSSVMLSICQRPLVQIAMSLKAGFSLPPTPLIMKTIIWLVTRPSSKGTHLTSRNSSTTRSTAALHQTQLRAMAQPSQRIRNSSAILPTLRLKSLQKILTCSPTLARPLMDATMEALRLASERFDSRVGGSPVESPVTRDGSRTPQSWLNGAPLPSKEVLLTLLWALKVEKRKMELKGTQSSGALNSESSIQAPANTHILAIASSKRKREMGRRGSGKRCRLS